MFSRDLSAMMAEGGSSTPSLGHPLRLGLGVILQGCQANAKGFQWRTSRSLGYRLSLAPTVPLPIPIPWGHAGCHHGWPLPHRKWGAHTSHPKNLLPAINRCSPTWMPPNCGCPSFWMPTPCLEENTCMATLPPTYPPSSHTSHTWMPQILDAASSWMRHTSGCPPTYVPLPSGCSAHIWMPPLPG